VHAPNECWLTVYKSWKKEKNNNEHVKNKLNVTCFNCNEKGHYSNECPHPDKRENAKETGTTLLLSGVSQGEIDDTNDVAFIFHQQGFAVTLTSNAYNGVPKSWIFVGKSINN
jgi:Zinc knuckle